MVAPVCLFTYNRPDKTQQSIEALKENYLARETDLYVFSDGPKNSDAEKRVEEVRNYLNKITGFKSVTVYCAPQNKGLAKSIIEGVTKIVTQYKKVIVLEDDLVTSKNFLDFMNQALDFYRDNQRVFSISGYTMSLPTLSRYDKDYYLGLRGSSWGWGTWEDRWNDVDWEVKNWKSDLINPVNHYQLARIGSDMPLMLWKQMNGKIDSWAIRWCYSQYKKKMYTIFASQSKLQSIGFGIDATHTKNTNRFNTDVDSGNKRSFRFEKEIQENETLIREFRRKFSVVNRAKDKIGW